MRNKNTKLNIMKKILIVSGIFSVFIGCNSNPKLDTTKQIVGDSSRLYNNTLYTDTAKSIQAVAPGGAVKSVREVTYTDNNGIKTKTTTTTTTAPVGTRTTHHYANRSGVSNNASSNNSSSNTTTTTTRRKGWSSGAKDAVIGGVGGAVLGAVVDKKHGQGAIIGGVAGAAGGYLLGHSKDKKDGRIR